MSQGVVLWYRFTLKKIWHAIFFFANLHACSSVPEDFEGLLESCVYAQIPADRLLRSNPMVHYLHSAIIRKEPKSLHEERYLVSDAGQISSRELRFDRKSIFITVSNKAHFLSQPEIPTLSKYYIYQTEIRQSMGIVV